MSEDLRRGPTSIWLPTMTLFLQLRQEEGLPLLALWTLASAERRFYFAAGQCRKMAVEVGSLSTFRVGK
jgi:hypothetical protein